jgi:hypothetical protein
VSGSEPLVEREPDRSAALPPVPGSGAESAPQAQPQPLHLGLAVLSATRSVMMFTLEFRLTLANRADIAVRNISISGELACARRGQPNAPSLAAATPLETIERIGPQQSRTITATLQMPMREVSAIRQGDKMLFIPLLHITLEGAGQRAGATSFVIGTPSQASQLRVHPLSLDSPVGTVRDLRANEVRLFEAREPA